MTLLLNIIFLLVLSTFSLPLSHSDGPPIISRFQHQNSQSKYSYRRMTEYDRRKHSQNRTSFVQRNQKHEDEQTHVAYDEGGTTRVRQASKDVRAVGCTVTRSTLSTVTLKSIVGDSGMRSESLRIALEGWNFCNRAGSVESWKDGVVLPSPRYADCADVICQTESPDPSLCRVKQLVSSFVNDLKVGMPFPSDFKWPSSLPFNLSDPDVYAVAKEIYLGEMCAVYDSQQDGEEHGASRSRPWNFWMIMLKNGNFDPDFGQCLATSTRGGPFFLPRFEMSSTKRLTSDPYHHNLGHLTHAYSEPHTSAPKMPPKAFHASPRVVRSGNRTVVTLDRMSAAATSNAFPCFSAGCMNQPKVQHALSDVQVSSGEVVGLKGGFYGTYDIATDLPTTTVQMKAPGIRLSKDIRKRTNRKSHRNIDAFTDRSELSSAPELSVTSSEGDGRQHTVDSTETVALTTRKDSQDVRNDTSVPPNSTPPTEDNISLTSYGPSVEGNTSEVDPRNVKRGRIEAESSANQTSQFSVEWEKDLHTGSWVLNHKLRVSEKYPWLMLYLRADTASGVSGGYPWDTRGMMKEVPSSPNFRVRHTLNVISSGGPASQFYLIDIGGCWKNSGSPCDGDEKSDVTRYSEMILNPASASWCSPSQLATCPPFHTKVDGTVISRNDVLQFPYDAYHLYCSPSNALLPYEPVAICDPYSNPQPQELVQLLPHKEWAPHGLPAVKGEGWLSGPNSWDMDMGALSARLYFYQDPLTFPAKRVWPSIDVGTEIYISGGTEQAEWTLSDFDVLVEP